ncbi:MAG: hypothetical protein Alpg2KO_28790 [Alphaproteobacteria bacterium]
MLDKLVSWGEREKEPPGYSPRDLPVRDVSKLSATAVTQMQQRQRQAVDAVVDKVLGDNKDDEQARRAMRRLIRARRRNRKRYKAKDLAEFGALTVDGMVDAARTEEDESPLSLTEVRKYREKATSDTARDVPEFTERYEQIFDGPHEHRIYIPLLPSIAQDGDYMSGTHAKVTDALVAGGFTGIDYRTGVCKDDRKNTIKIAKALHRLDEVVLAGDFERDPSRKLDPNKLCIAISRHPYDVARMSTGRGWVSCMAKDGSYHHHVSGDLREGTLVAYLISKNDPNIDDPLSRILLKPMRHADTGETTFSVCSAYGLHAPQFNETLKEFVAQHIAPDLSPGGYNLSRGVYDDNDNSYQHQLPAEVMDDPVAFLKHRKIRHIKVGKRIFAWGDIHLAQHGLTRLPDLSNVTLYGSLNAAFNQLTDLKGFPRKVTGSVGLWNNRLRHLQELQGKSFRSLDVRRNLLQSLEGGPKSVEDHFHCTENPLVTLKGMAKFGRQSFTPFGHYNNYDSVPKEMLTKDRLDPRGPGAAPGA